MKFTIIVLIIALRLEISRTNNETWRLKRQKGCTPDLKFTSCDGYKTLYRHRKMALVVRYDPCDTPYSDVIFDWNFLGNKLKYENHHGKVSYVIPPFFFGSKVKSSGVKVTAHNKKKGLHLVTTCKLIIKPQEPIPVIDGANKRSSAADQNIICTATSSRYVADPTGATTLYYSWYYEYTGENDEVVYDTSEDAVLIIPASLAIKGRIFTIKLIIGEIQKDLVWPAEQYASQIVKVGKFDVDIRGIRNYPPASIVTKPDTMTEFRIDCRPGLCGPDTFMWFFNDRLLPSTGRSIAFGPKYFKENKEHSLDFSNDKESSGSIKFSLYKTQLVMGCELEPKEGIHQVTWFRIQNCQYQQDAEEQSIFEVFSNGDYLKQTADLPDAFYFTLNVGADLVTMRKTDQYGITQDYTFPVEIKMKGTQNNTQEELIKDIYYGTKTESVASMINGKKYDKAIDTINTVTNLLQLNTNEDFGKGMKESLLHDLHAIPVYGMDSIVKMASIVKKIQNIEYNDPAFGRSSTELCANLAKANLQLLKHEAATMQKAEAENIITKLIACSIGENYVNWSIIQGQEVEIVITTPAPLLEFQGFTEHYPDYLNLEGVSNHISNLEAAAQNFVKTCKFNSESIAVVIKGGQRTMETEECVVGVIRDIVAKTTKVPIVALDVKFTISKDYATSKKLVDVTICVPNKDNPFWFSSDKHYLTRVAVIDASWIENGENKKLGDVKEPHIIDFPLMVKISSKFFPNTLSANDTRAIHIVEVPANVKITLIFELNDEDFFRVEVTNFERLEENFNWNVTKAKNVIFQPLPAVDYNTWHVVVVEPQNKTGPVSYKIAAYTTYCNKWNEKNGTWEFSCLGTFLEKENVIRCRCNHLSTFTGMLEYANIFVMNYSAEHELDIVVPFKKNYIIPVITFLIYASYCLLLCFGIKEVEGFSEKIYWLSDTTHNSRYAYFIIVKTGGQIGAGTTSNVTINLIGEKDQSKAHVLNYPDPYQEILQRNGEDWFILGSEKYLGELLAVQIWFDSTGSHPTWFCDFLVIYDLQDQRWYNFPVHTWFEVVYKGIVFTEVFASTKTIRQGGRKDQLANWISKFLPMNSKLWTLTTSSQGIEFSYCMRLTCMMSIILCLCLITLVFYGLPNMEISDAFAVAPNFDFYSFIFTYGLYSALITCGIHCPTIMILRKQKDNLEEYSNLNCNMANLKDDCRTFLIILIMVNFTLLSFLGFWVPKINALLWLTSTIFAFLLYVFLLQGAFEAIVYIFQTQEYINPVTHCILKAVKYVEAQRRYLYKSFGSLLLRPYLKHLHKPLTKEEVKSKKQKELVKLNIVDTLEDLVIFLMYITLLYLVVLSNKHSMDIHSHDHVVTLIENGKTGESQIEKVYTPATLLTYIEETLIPTLQSYVWYGTYGVKEPGLVSDFSNKYLGVARIRQHRAAANCCTVHTRMRFLNVTCECNYYKSQEKKSFAEKWTSDLPSLGRHSRMTASWHYVAPSEDQSYTTYGKMGHYEGGGYILPLGRTIKNSYINLKYLQSTSWIDDLTRSVFIEFLLYNANFNIFNSAEIMIEKGVTGFLKIKVDVHTSRLLFVSRDTRIVVTWIFAFYLIFVLLLLLKNIHRIIKQKSIWSKDDWRLIDLVLLILSIIGVFIFIDKTNDVGKLLKRLEEAKFNQFISYFQIMRSDEIFTLVAAILICLATIRLWKLFRFAKIFKIVEKTLQWSFRSLCGLLLCHIVLLNAFGFMGYMLFGSEDPEFKDAWSILNTMTQMLLFLKQDNVAMFDRSRRGLGVFFFVLYSLTSLVLATAYAVIIMIYYTEALVFYSNEQQAYGIKGYVRDEFDYMVMLLKAKLLMLKRNLAGGQSDGIKPMVNAKADEHRYADFMGVERDRMTAMALICRCTIRNIAERPKSSLNQGDHRLILYTLMYLVKSKQSEEDEEKQLKFFKGRCGGNKFKLIDDKTLIKIEKMTNYILHLQLSDYAEKRREINRRYQALVDENAEMLKKMNYELRVTLQLMKRIEIAS